MTNSSKHLTRESGHTDANTGADPGFNKGDAKQKGDGTNLLFCPENCMELKKILDREGARAHSALFRSATAIKYIILINVQSIYYEYHSLLIFKLLMNY